DDDGVDVLAGQQVGITLIRLDVAADLLGGDVEVGLPEVTQGDDLGVLVDQGGVEHLVAAVAQADEAEADAAGGAEDARGGQGAQAGGAGGAGEVTAGGVGHGYGSGGCSAAWGWYTPRSPEKQRPGRGRERWPRTRCSRGCMRWWCATRLRSPTR